MRSRLLLVSLPLLFLLSCSKIDYLKSRLNDKDSKEDPSSFSEIGMIDIGDAGAAEISAYDPKSQKLFVVNNGTVKKIDIIGLSNLGALSVIRSIDVATFGGLVNSVAVNGGLLAAAIESLNKQEPGKVVVFRTDDYSVVKVISVGALPDMVTFSPDGKYILTANEGEPNADYTVDPIGSVSIINVKQGYAVVNLDFSSFENSLGNLRKNGFRVFGPDASIAEDIEPEYVTVSEDSRTAWVTLQENNGIAKIDLGSRRITDIFPLGFKDDNLAKNGIDASNADGKIEFNARPVKSMYLPDAIAVMVDKGVPYLFTANEGDVREYDAFEEAIRIKDIRLDPQRFPNAAALQQDNQLGRLYITTTLGDKDNDGDFDELYSFGARSFSVWNGNTGALVADIKNDLEKQAVAASFYDDGRSDDKGVEPEGLAIGKVGKTALAFVGLERADAVAVYDVTNPANPKFLQILRTGDAPEGILFIPAKDSPTKKSLLVVSSEDDGVIRFYSPQN